MKRDDLERSFDDTPSVFTQRIDDTLRGLKEEVPVKRFTLRAAALVMLVLLLMCGIAYAIVATQGQDWYYNNRFTAYQEHEPDKQQAIFDHLETDVPQEENRDEQGLVDMVVQDYSWAQEQRVFTMSIATRATDPEQYELYSIERLDQDGEEREAHYLTTSKGMGLPEDVMLDPDKTLLLMDTNSFTVCIGDTNIELPMWSYDEFISEDGASVSVLEFDLRWLEDDYVMEQFGMKPTPSPQGNEAMLRLQQCLSDLGYYSGDPNREDEAEAILCLKNFQTMNGLTADGTLNDETINKLYGSDALDVYGEVYAEVEVETPTLEDAADNAERCEYFLKKAKAMREAITANTDADGMLTLRIPFTVWQMEQQELTQRSAGVKSFQVKLK